MSSTSKRVFVVVFSGGQDSTTCLAKVLTENPGQSIIALTIDYGQRHRAEVDAARRVLAVANARFDKNIQHHVVNARGMLLGASPLVNRTTEVETYASAEELPGGLEKTFVPMRNTFFLTIAANLAIASATLILGADSAEIVTGVSQEDYGGYPDCREAFIVALQRTFRISLDDPSLPILSISTPLLNLTKKQTVELSEKLPHCRDMLAWSHTCYNGAVPPCGKCHACLLRAKGYQEAGVVDPLLERLSFSGGGLGLAQK